MDDTKKSQLKTMGAATAAGVVAAVAVNLATPNTTGSSRTPQAQPNTTVQVTPSASIVPRRSAFDVRLNDFTVVGPGVFINPGKSVKVGWSINPNTDIEVSIHGAGADGILVEDGHHEDRGEYTDYIVTLRNPTDKRVRVRAVPKVTLR